MAFLSNSENLFSFIFLDKLFTTNTQNANVISVKIIFLKTKFITDTPPTNTGDNVADVAVSPPTTIKDRSIGINILTMLIMLFTVVYAIDNTSLKLTNTKVTIVIKIM